MVHTNKNKLTIEITDNSPIDYLQNLQREIINAIQEHDYKNYGNSCGCPFYHLLDLLESTLPTYYQQKQMIEFTNMANDTAISKTDIVEWFTSRKEFLLKEIANL